MEYRVTRIIRTNGDVQLAELHTGEFGIARGMRQGDAMPRFGIVTKKLADAERYYQDITE